MRPARALPLLAALLLAPVLGGCAVGAYISPATPLERAVNGTYEGVGSGLTGRVPYRLVLTVQERTGRASGVLTNLESKKAYAATGSFRPAAGGGALDLTMYEEGDRYRAALHGELRAGAITGQIKTVLLGKELFPYNVTLNKVPATP
ncbi:hypothetical protein [Deinococcus petrolearius]|uniref:Uncharacterized protein n=1 Tax=Deinococcus petrolearius TaxID=1751295 RepID=A0ABW1DGP7_9DEIO